MKPVHFSPASLFPARSPARSGWRLPCSLALVGGLLASVSSHAHQPLGSNARVNSIDNSAPLQPRVAVDADGGAVAVWLGIDPVADPTYSQGSDIFFRRVSRDGMALGADVRVNAGLDGDQSSPDVALDADGDFVIVWQNDGFSGGIWARRYSAAGIASGAAFEVSSSGGSPRVARGRDGAFVVVWQDSAGADEDVYARRYDASGGVIDASPFMVSSASAGRQLLPAVAADASGGFVVAWQGVNAEETEMTIHARRYSSAGTPLTGELAAGVINGFSSNPVDVDVDADGDFVVAWADPINDRQDIFVRRYAPSGSPKAAAIKVNQFGSDTGFSLVQSPSVGMDADGDFSVVWQDNLQAGNSNSGVYARRYSAAGIARSPEIRINDTPTFNNTDPVIAMDTDGDFLVSWLQFDQQALDNDDTVVLMQRQVADDLNSALSVKRNSVSTDPTPVAGGPAGTNRFNIQYCNNGSVDLLTGLSIKLVTLSNGNNLLNRSRDAAAEPDAVAVRTGGPGAEIDFPATTGYRDLRLLSGECVTVPYRIGLANNARYVFGVEVRGDRGQ